MESKGQIYEAIPAILADVDAIGKNKKNQQQGYNFRGIDDVYNMVHPLLAKHRVFPTCEIISTGKEERATKTGGVLFYVTLKAQYTFWAADGSSVWTEALGEAMDSGDKATNKAMSAAYKYALFQLLCIPTEDVDSESDTHEPAPKRTDVEPRKAQPAKPAPPNPAIPKDKDGNFDHVGYFRKKIGIENTPEGLDAAVKELAKNKDQVGAEYQSLLREWFERAIECADHEANATGKFTSDEEKREVINERVKHLDTILAKAKGALGMIDGKDAFVVLGAALDRKYQKEVAA